MDNLEQLKERDEEILTKVTDTFRAAMEELLPRIHLHVFEHGPSLRLNAEVLLKVTSEKEIAGAVDLSIDNPPPRAMAHFGIDDTEPHANS